MSDFITNSLCHKLKPRRYAKIRLWPRPEKVTKLMRERDVVRFVVAPSGYGKSVLLLQYCEIVDGFEHTMWIDATSPCLLRELDERALGQKILHRGNDVRIVVFDDIPHLGAQRADELSAVFNELINAGVEVLASCRPSCDAFEARQIDRICLKSRDLMLTDEERAELEERRAASSQGEAEMSDSDAGTECANRIPALAWGSEKAPARFAKGITDEELTDELLAAQLTAYVLRSASLSWACARSGLSAETLIVLKGYYPHLGISVEDDQFETVPLEVNDLAAAFSSHLADLSACFSLETRDDVCLLLADMLLENGVPDRACDLMAALASQTARISWLLERGEQLFRALCIEPAWRLRNSLYKVRADEEGSVLDTHQAWRLYLLGDTRGAFKLALTVVARVMTPRAQRAWCLLLMMRIDKGEVRKKALGALARMLPEPKQDSLASPQQEPWVVLAVSYLSRSEVLEGADDEGQVSLSAARYVEESWLVSAQLSSSGEVALLAGASLLDICPELMCNDALVTYAEQAVDCFGAIQLEAFRRISECSSHGAIDEDALRTVFPEEAADALRHAEMEMMGQQRAFSRVRRVRDNKRALRSDAVLMTGFDDDPRLAIPQLQVSLFGGMEVEMGGRRLQAEYFTKSKMRALLAILVMASGREVSRDRVIAALWPNSLISTAKKNLYGNWSELGRTLSLPDGTCPYLRSVQGSYRIDRRYVQSDVDRVEALCREVTVDRVDATRLRALVDELDRLYRGDFVPAETKIEAILDARRTYRNMVTDALVLSSLRLLDMGEGQLAIWAAKKALEHERELEDPYYALMNAQVACGQREGAIITFRQCANTLNRLYRMDPSERMLDLHRQLTLVEAKF